MCSLRGFHVLIATNTVRLTMLSEYIALESIKMTSKAGCWILKINIESIYWSFSFLGDDVWSKIYEKVDQDGKKIWCCSLCSHYSIHHRSDLRKHVETKHFFAPQMECQYCRKHYPNKHALRKHILRTHERKNDPFFSTGFLD